MKPLVIISTIISTITLAGIAVSMKPHLYFEANTLGSIQIDADEIIVDFEAGKPVTKPSQKDELFKVSNGNTFVIITADDKAAGAAWIKKNDQRGRLSINNGDLYLDGGIIDMNGAEVSEIFEALPWNQGILCIGRIYRKKSKERAHAIGDLFRISPEDIEPYCAVWINPVTRRGSCRWLYGKVRRNLFVYPLPR